MWFDRDRKAWLLSLVYALLASGLFLMVLTDAVDGAAASRKHSTTRAAAAPDTLVPEPDVRDTPANLQAAFDNEVNAKERYVAYAQQAEREDFRAAARVFRACAKAESVHARRHVQAIAVTGAQARAVLERFEVHGTADNLRAAISGESYEVEHWYPALLARARAEHWPEAVRGIVGARSAERQHLLLLTDALTHLEERPAPVTLYVCSFCGRTVEHLDPDKCPNCFTSSRRFISVPEEAAVPAKAPRAEPRTR
jgi:rubrerythrin